VTGRLLAPILQELRQLQLDGCASNCSSSSSGCSSSACTCQLSTESREDSPGQARAHTAQAIDLGLLPPFQRFQAAGGSEGQGRSVLRLCCVRSELVKTCYCCHTLGSLTWVQVAKITGLVYPRSLSFNALGKAVSDVLDGKPSSPEASSRSGQVHNEVERVCALVQVCMTWHYLMLLGCAVPGSMLWQ